MLSVAVLSQSRQLENMLDDGDQYFRNKGYKSGRLSSPFIRMRRLQLKVISTTFIISNVLIVTEMVYLGLFMAERYEMCSSLCAQPYDRRAAAILFLMSLFHCLTVQMYIIAFYFIPRRFHVEVYDVAESIRIDRLYGPNSPLLPDEHDNFQQIDDDINWQRRQRDTQTSGTGEFGTTNSEASSRQSKRMKRRLSDRRKREKRPSACDDDYVRSPGGFS